MPYYLMKSRLAHRGKSEERLRNLLKEQVQARVAIPDYFGKPWGWKKAKAQVLNIHQNASTHPILDELTQRGIPRQRAISLLMQLPQQAQSVEVVRKPSRRAK